MLFWVLEICCAVWVGLVWFGLMVLVWLDLIRSGCIAWFLLVWFGLVICSVRFGPACLCFMAFISGGGEVSCRYVPFPETNKRANGFR